MKIDGFISKEYVGLTEAERSRFVDVISRTLGEFDAFSGKAQARDGGLSALIVRWGLDKEIRSEWHFKDRRRRVRGVTYIIFVCHKMTDGGGGVQYSLHALPSDGEHQTGYRRRWRKGFDCAHNYAYDTEIEGFAADIQLMVQDYLNALPAGTDTW